MKTVVVTLAVLVLVIIGLNNHRHNYTTVRCDKGNSPAQTISTKEAQRNKNSSKASVAPSGLINFSGKNMNFFLMTF